MRLLPLLLLFCATACRTAAPALPPPPPDADVETLRLENERLRRLLAVDAGADCPPAEQARRGETVEVLLSDLFFESGSADLTPEGQARLDATAQKLARDYAGRTVRVEGHTDTQPIGPSLKGRYPSNWELSAARAAAVARYLETAHNLPPGRMEAVGLGPYDPVDSNATAEGRARNRRVRLAVLPF